MQHTQHHFTAVFDSVQNTWFIDTNITPSGIGASIYTPATEEWVWSDITPEVQELDTQLLRELTSAVMALSVNRSAS